MSAPDLELEDVEPRLRAGVVLDAIALQARAWERKRPRGVSMRDLLQGMALDLQLVHLIASRCEESGVLDDDEMRALMLSKQSIEILISEAVRAAGPST